jgi:hypothetical protein
MKGSLIGFVVASLGIIGAAGIGATGCSSSSGGGGSNTPPGTYCDQMVAGSEICTGYTNLNSDQANSVNMACTSAGGKTVSSCPSANQVGCCSYTQSGYTVSACYYCPSSASADSMACMAQSGAKWAAGSAMCSSGSSSGGGDSGSGSGSSSGGGGDAGSSSSSGGGGDAASE